MSLKSLLARLRGSPKVDESLTQAFPVFGNLTRSPLVLDQHEYTWDGHGPKVSRDKGEGITVQVVAREQGPTDADVEVYSRIVADLRTLESQAREVLVGSIAAGVGDGFLPVEASAAHFELDGIWMEGEGSESFTLTFHHPEDLDGIWWVSFTDFQPDPTSGVRDD